MRRLVFKFHLDVIILGIIFLLLPLYSSESGSLQPVDLAIFMLTLVYLIRGDFKINQLGFVLNIKAILFLLLMFQTIILTVHLIVGSDTEEIIQIYYNLYFMYLFLIFFIAFKKIDAYADYLYFYRIMMYCLLVTLFIPIGFVVLHSDLVHFSRKILVFNNSNQIMFFCFTNLSILYYLRLEANNLECEGFFFRTLAILGANLYLLILSASRAGTFILVLWVYTLWMTLSPRFKSKAKLVGFFCGVVFCILISLIVYEYFYHKLSLVRSDISTIIVQNDLYMRTLAGIGGSFENLTAFFWGKGAVVNVYGIEYHNNFVNIFYQTGVFMLLLYGIFCFSIFFRLLSKGWRYVMPFLVYIAISDSHYFFRSRFCWVFLAFTVFIIEKHHIEKWNSVRRKER